jgi:hypothetical protein
MTEETQAAPAELEAVKAILCDPLWLNEAGEHTAYLKKGVGASYAGQRHFSALQPLEDAARELAVIGPREHPTPPEPEPPSLGAELLSVEEEGLAEGGEGEQNPGDEDIAPIRAGSASTDEAGPMDLQGERESSPLYGERLRGADIASYPGSLIDQRRNDLSLIIDGLAADRNSAAQDIIRNTDIVELRHLIIMGHATDAQRDAERAYNAAGVRIAAVLAYAETLKRSLRDQNGDELDRFDPNAVEWP